jgi:hypothetical protein
VNVNSHSWCYNINLIESDDSEHTVIKLINPLKIVKLMWLTDDQLNQVEHEMFLSLNVSDYME